MYWVEAWVPSLGEWCSSTAHHSETAAFRDAENRRDTYRRDYRVTDEDRRVLARYAYPGYWAARKDCTLPHRTLIVDLRPRR